MKSTAKTAVKSLVAALLGTVSSGVWANPERWQLNMTEGVTEVSRSVQGLHMTIFYICVVIGVLVFGAMFYSMFKFRKSKGAVAAKWSHSTVAEAIWTVVPILILVVMAIPATRVLYQMYDTGKPEMTVAITGYQWLWEYEYQGEGVKFTSRLDRESDKIRRLKSGLDPNAAPNYLIDVDNPLVIPADTKVRFVLTADDVIHAWWVPAFAFKQDAIPGFINEAWTNVDGKEIPPGGRLFRGQCTELCGKDHGFMPIVVKVVPKNEFKAELAQLRVKHGSPLEPAAPVLAAQPAPQAATLQK
jgi:cytochrome c oxidase subunit II